jgi:hypothetical protein
MATVWGAIQILSTSPIYLQLAVGKLLRSVQQRRERYEFEGEVVDHERMSEGGSIH